MCALHRESIFLLLLMVKNKKVTIKNTKVLLDYTSTTTNYRASGPVHHAAAGVECWWHQILVKIILNLTSVGR